MHALSSSPRRSAAESSLPSLPSCPGEYVVAARPLLSKAFKYVGKRLRSKRKSAQQTTSSGYPYIPPEVWGVVIQHASSHDCDLVNNASHRLSFLEDTSTRFDSYRASLKSKLTLMRVCRAWHAYAVEQLYEFIWISSAAQAKKLAHTLVLQSLQSPACTYGSFVRRIHIQTPVLERCAPADLLAIVEVTPNLVVYSDHHSLQRSLYDDGPDPRCSPEAILKLVANPKIRRLSWTSYGDAPFQQRMTPLLTNLATQLEFLELSSCSPNFRAMFAQPTTAGTKMDVRLPSLKALKLSLDNNTFAVLSSWDMPKLANLSVLSSDFSYTGPGFASFFQAHGEKLVQLELGHSSSLIEKHYLTAPHRAQPATPIPLATWCPNLREFICSADAEWHWQSPDWITAHILLPAHPNIEFIGIRDIDKRMRDDPDSFSREPFFTLYELLASLLRKDAFPALKYLRDLSAESHRMRSYRPQARVKQFWERVIEQSGNRAVWLEDCHGFNINIRTLLRAEQTHFD
ncbi:hypothetical protein PsYK624_058390 [Phanerochaete sordida]|uniref:F-box domain-containing protein n=1 Tax=Phanerochaete sordida TaxID=48140 RepID=A0A9P3G5S2_9APHY|nr:hypothetical protein PsYK624_058390 [Phanerochaete sordida]